VAVRVVLVDDHEIVRAGLATLLDQEDDITVVGAAASAERAIELIDVLSPDVAVVDHNLPGMSGVALCEHLGARSPDVKVIILTTFLDDEIVSRAVEAGARAYLHKDVDATNLKRAIRAVARGEEVLDPKVAGRVTRWARASRSGAEERLSAREIDVLRLAATGLANSEIAHRLGLSENTVKTYLRRTMQKLRCRSRTEAALVAAKRGLL
jgi:DNA-binding NarL/FixJ family response regulator